MIFLSYASEDAALARTLALEMQRAGARVWCAVFKDELNDGRPWRKQIYAALESCDTLVILVTGAPLDGTTDEECDRAIDRHNKDERPRVIPLRPSDRVELPAHLQRFHSATLPADWQSETSDFITRKLRQWDEIAEPAPAPEQAPTSTPQRDVAPSASTPPTPPPTPQPLRTPAARTSRRSAIPAIARPWLKRLAAFVSIAVLAWLGWARLGRAWFAKDFVARQSPEMVEIPAGLFLMGDEDSPHAVTVAAFELAKTEVTRGQWRDVVGDHPKDAAWSTEDRSDDQLPADVTWEEAKKFCEVLSDREGRVDAQRYRLPSEAEWEYACRAKKYTMFWSGDTESDLARVGWFEKNSGHQVQAVGEKPANPWGLFDMHGNVVEWCEDSWHVSYEGAPSDGSAWVDEASADRVIRGGCFVSAAAEARSAARDRDHSSARSEFVGFRPARSVTTD